MIDVDTLLQIGSAAGAEALGLERWPDAVVDLDHPQLRGVEDEDVYGALLFGCTGDVLRNTSDQ